MKKLLITGGDSYTSPDYVTYKELNVTTWPQQLADMNDWDLVNTGTAGCTNRHIVNSVIDAILQNEHRTDMMVIVSWSEVLRLSYIDDQSIDSSIFMLSNSEFKERTSRSENLKKFFERLNPAREGILALIHEQLKRTHSRTVDMGVDFQSSMITQAFFNMWLLQNFCEQRGIEFYHFNTFDPMVLPKDLSKGILGQSTPEELVMEKLTSNRYIGDVESFSGYGGVNHNFYADIEKDDMFIYIGGERNQHPNSEGHKFMANEINDFITTGERKNNRTDNEKTFTFFE